VHIQYTYTTRTPWIFVAFRVSLPTMPNPPPVRCPGTRSTTPSWAWSIIRRHLPRAETTPVRHTPHSEPNSLAVSRLPCQNPARGFWHSWAPLSTLEHARRAAATVTPNWRAIRLQLHPSARSWHSALQSGGPTLRYSRFGRGQVSPPAHKWSAMCRMT